jgi:putative membrane protein
MSADKAGPGSTSRDELALVRTHLANERTLLAYVRTGLAFSAGGAGLILFISSRPSWILGWSLVGVGLAVIISGVARFSVVRGSISRFQA